MKRRAGILSGLALLAAACAAPVEPAPEPDTGANAAEAVPETPDPEVQGPEVQGPEAQGEVKPSMDPLDRVDDTCGLEAVKPYLGKPAADLPEGLLKPADRVLTPTSQVTMDYVPERLNVLTNAGGVIIGLKCG